MSQNSRAARMVTRALIAALDDTAAEGDATNLRRVVDSLIAKAIGGDLAAIREIFDRVDGKATAAAALDGESDDEPRKIVFEWGTE
jgi:ribosomal protein L17